MARKKLSSRTRRQLQRGFVVITLLLLLVALIVVAILDRRVTAQFEGRRWTLPARVYAQPVDLYVGQKLSAERWRSSSNGWATSRCRRRIARAPTGAAVSASKCTCVVSASPTSFSRRACCGSASSATGSASWSMRRAGHPGLSARSAPDRQHLPGARRGPHHRLAGPGAADAARGAEGRRGSHFRYASRHQSEGDPARVVRQRPRRTGRAGRQHADAAARQELLPRQPAYAAPQDRGSGDGHDPRGALREGGHHERLHQRDLSRAGRLGARFTASVLRASSISASRSRSWICTRSRCWSRSCAGRRSTIRAGIPNGRSSGATSCSGCWRHRG